MSTVDLTNAADAARAVRGRPADDCGGPTVRRSQTITKLAAALAKAQQKVKNPPKDSVNPHFKSRYADLATVIDTVLPVLSEHGLAVVQMPCELGDHPALCTLLTHESGEWVESTMRTRPSKTDPQGQGSAITYARRYALQAVVGVAADDDDDGNEASRPAPVAASRPSGDNHNPAIAKLAAAYASCKDMAGFERLEQERAQLWTRIDGAAKNRLKPIADETRERLAGAAV